MNIATISHFSVFGFVRFMCVLALMPAIAWADVNPGFQQSFESTGLPDNWSNDASSTVGWQVSSDDSFVGANSLRSGDIAHRQNSAIEWTDTFGDGLLTFKARVDSESCCDYLRVYLDGALQLSVSGTGTTWNSQSIEIAPGVHTVRFEYSKDGSVDRGADAAFIDDLRFIQLPALGTTIGNILVIQGRRLYEATPDGTVLRTLDIPSSSSPRSPELLDDGRIAIFDAPNLHVYQPATGTWVTIGLPGWSPGSIEDNGRLVEVGNFIYATQHAPNSTSLIRFDISDLSLTVVPTTKGYIDLALGLDGNLYALDSYSGTADVLDPADLSVIGTRNFGGDSRSISVDEAGQIFGVGWSGFLRRYGMDDVEQASLNLDIGIAYDIDRLADGAIVVGGRNGAVVVTDSALSTTVVFNPTGSFNESFVRFIGPGPDTDGDTLPDRWESTYGLNPADPADAILDGDGDGLDNLSEFDNGTNPLLQDTDGDGLTDFDEVITTGTPPTNPDADSDGLNDYQETQVTNTDPFDTDSDDDSLSDWEEVVVHATNPLEPDTDSDGLTDDWELENGLDPNDPADAAMDPDADGLTSLEEHAAATDPQNDDSDGDSLLDGAEVNTHLTNPLDRDTDSDLIDDASELAAGLDPLVDADAALDADADGFSNLIEFFAGSDLNDAASEPAVGSWTMHQGNKEHNGYLPLLLDSNDFALRWVRESDGNIWQQPVTKNGRVFISTDRRYGPQFIRALDARDGSTRWGNELLSQSSSLPGIQYVSAPSIANDRIYLHSGGSQDTFLWSFDQQDGDLIFQSPHGGQSPRYSAPTVVDDRAYMNGGTYGGALSFDALSGESLWFSNNADWADFWEPAIDDDYAYVPYTAGGILALNLDTGGIEFSIAGTEVRSSPVLGSSENIVTGGNDLTSFDLENGSVNWMVPGNVGQPSVGLGKVFVIRNADLYVYEEATGDLLWAWSPPVTAIVSNVVLTASHAFVATTSTTHAVDLQAQTSVWSYGLGGKLSLSNEGALFIASGDGRIAAIDIEGDDDGDALPNWWERIYGLDSDNAADAALDIDTDGLTALQEFGVGSDPTDADSDDDLLTDGAEVNTHDTDPIDPDSDDDDLSDGEELNVHMTDPNDGDSDDDGLSDGAEVNTHGSSPLSADTDEDEIDDFWEVSNALDPADSADASFDRDTDGLTELDEYISGTEPRNADTDGDGLADGEEVNEFGTNPLLVDTDGDFLIDAAEISIGLDPLNVDDGGADHDLDGYINRAEYFANTDLNDALSRPRPARWATHQGNASHNGYNPLLVSLADIDFKWEMDLSVYELRQVTEADGRVFVSDFPVSSIDATLWALNESDGTTAWSKPYTDVRRLNPPAWGNGAVYLQTYDIYGDSHLRAYDAASGNFIYKVEYNRDFDAHYAPTPWGDSIYLSGSRSVLAFDAYDGTQQWQEYADTYGRVSPAVTEDHVVLWARDYILIFDRQAGGLSYQIRNDSAFSFNDGSTVLGNYSNTLSIRAGKLAAYNYISPAPQWAVERAFTAQPSLAQGIVFSVDAGTLSVRNEFNGEYLWGWESLAGQLINTIAVAANIVFVSTANETYAIGLDSQQAEWTYPKGGHLSLSASGTLYIAAADGVLVAIDLTSDRDNDQLPDAWEIANSMDPDSAGDADGDSDGDGLSNRQEFNLNTSPDLSDSDGDGMPDKYEWEYGLTPTDAADASEDMDGDGYTNADEFAQGTSPTDANDRPAASSGSSAVNPVLFLALLLLPTLRRRYAK